LDFSSFEEENDFYFFEGFFLEEIDCDSGFWIDFWSEKVTWMKNGSLKVNKLLTFSLHLFSLVP